VHLSPTFIYSPKLKILALQECDMNGLLLETHFTIHCTGAGIGTTCVLSLDVSGAKFLIHLPIYFLSVDNSTMHYYKCSQNDKACFIY